jgi:hypothetical protein
VEDLAVSPWRPYHRRSDKLDIDYRLHDGECYGTRWTYERLLREMTVSADLRERLEGMRGLDTNEAESMIVRLIMAGW